MVQFSLEVPVYKQSTVLTESGESFQEILDGRMFITSVLPQSFIDFADERDINKNDFVCLEINSKKYIMHKEMLSRFRTVDEICK